MDQPDKVVNPARGQLNMNISLSPCSRLRNWSRETGSAVSSRVSLLISILGLNLVLTYGISLESRGGVQSFILTTRKPRLDYGMHWYART